MKELIKSGSAHIPDPLPTPDEIAARLDPYIEAHKSKVEAAKKTYVENLEKAEAIISEAAEKGKEAVDAGDIEALAKFTGMEEAARHSLVRIQKALIEIDESAIFPPGSVMQEWETICREYEPAYMGALASVREAATQYRTAVAAFMELHSTLLAARAKMQETARKNGSDENITSRIITAGMKGEDYFWINKQDVACIPNAIDPTFSRGL